MPSAARGAAARMSPAHGARVSVLPPRGHPSPSFAPRLSRRHSAAVRTVRLEVRCDGWPPAALDFAAGLGDLALLRTQAAQALGLRGRVTVLRRPGQHPLVRNDVHGLTDGDVLLATPADGSEAGQVLPRLGIIALYAGVVALFLVVGGAILGGLERGPDVARRRADAGAVTEHMRGLNLSAAQRRGVLALLPGRCVGGAAAARGLCAAPASPWTQLGGTFFALTAATSIGYGTFAPLTLPGRTFTALYSVLGMTLVIMLLVQIAAMLPKIAMTLRHRMSASRAERGAKSALQDESPDAVFDQLASFDVIQEGGLDVEGLRDFLLRVAGDRVDAAALHHIMELVVPENDGNLTHVEAFDALLKWEDIKAAMPSHAKLTRIALSACSNLAWLAAWAPVFAAAEGWTVGEALWFGVVSLTTVGFGDYAPQSTAGHVLAFPFVIVGILGIAWLLESLRDLFSALLYNFYRWAHKRRLLSKALVLSLGVIPGRVDDGAGAVGERPEVRVARVTGAWGELSNLHPAPFPDEREYCPTCGRAEQWPSVEHYVQAARFADAGAAEQMRAAATPEAALALGRQWEEAGLLRGDWGRVRDAVMHRALTLKFRYNAGCATVLLATQRRRIVVDGDDAYGDRGAANPLARPAAAGAPNRLGALLESVRAELRGEAEADGSASPERENAEEAEAVWFFGSSHPEYGILTAFHPCRFRDQDGADWGSVEHYFQAAKFTDPRHRQDIRASASPAEANLLGTKRIPGRQLREDWDTYRFTAMLEGTQLKLRQNRAARQKLLETGNRPIVYDDRSASSGPYWGTGPDQAGRNNIGLILEIVRAGLRGVTVAGGERGAGYLPPPKPKGRVAAAAAWQRLRGVLGVNGAGRRAAPPRVQLAHALSRAGVPSELARGLLDGWLPALKPRRKYQQMLSSLSSSLRHPAAEADRGAPPPVHLPSSTGMNMTAVRGAPPTAAPGVHSLPLSVAVLSEGQLES